MDSGSPDALQHFVPAKDGLRLGYQDLRAAASDASLRPLVCLPGLTRNGRDFKAIAEFASHRYGRRVISVDYRGRGNSDRAPDPASYTVPIETQDVLTLLDHLDIGTADFIGTSRGGLILHLLAGMAPERLGKIIFNDIGPELGIEGLREIQSYLQPQPVLRSWDTAADQLRKLHQERFPLLADSDWQELARAIFVEGVNGIVADCDPAIAASFAGLDLSQPLPALWDLFDAFPDVPMMVIRGEHSQLLTVKTVERMRQHRPALVVHTAKGQGHAPLLHLDDLPDAIGNFLQQG